MSDGDRTLIGQKQRAAARVAGIPDPVAAEDSMPVIVDAGDDPTPVEIPGGGRRRRKRLTVQAFAEETKTELRDLRRSIADLTAAEFNVRAELVERIVKLETALEFVDGLGKSTDELRDLRDDVTSLRVTLIGEGGHNGRIGRLREEVKDARDLAESGPRFVRRAAIFALSSLLGSAIPAALYVRGVVADAAAERASTHAEFEAAKADRTVLHAQQLLLFRLLNAGSASPAKDSP